jgi:hypothetical protein
VVTEVIAIAERVEQGLKVERIRNAVTSLNTMIDDELKEFHLRNRYQIIPYLNIPIHPSRTFAYFYVTNCSHTFVKKMIYPYHSKMFTNIF